LVSDCDNAAEVRCLWVQNDIGCEPIRLVASLRLPRPTRHQRTAGVGNTAAPRCHPDVLRGGHQGIAMFDLFELIVWLNTVIWGN
jgi:hypothetical protein